MGVGICLHIEIYQHNEAILNYQFTKMTLFTGTWKRKPQELFAK